MFERPKMKAAIKAAEKILGERGRLKAAISSAVEDLRPLIARRLEAENLLAAAEVGAAIAAKPESEIGAARRSVEDAHAGIARQAFKLSALRGKAAEQGAQLADAYRAVKTLLAGHNQEAGERFREEWSAGVQQFSRLLARRAAMERVLGRMDLPEPAPSPDAVDLGDLIAPHRTIEDLRAAVDDLTGMASLAAVPVMAHPHIPLRHYDPQGVYTLASPFDAIPAGAAVIETSFYPGILGRLVATGRRGSV